MSGLLDGHSIAHIEAARREARELLLLFQGITHIHTHTHINIWGGLGAQIKSV